MRPFVSSYRLDTDPTGLAELYLRIREAATWWSVKACSPDPVACLRSPELKPARLPTEEHHWPDNAVVRDSVEFVARRRRELLNAVPVSLLSLDSAMDQCRFLGHDLGLCTYDDLPYSSTPFFDHQDNAGWNSWLQCIPAVAFGSAVLLTLSWIPVTFVEIADHGLCTSTDCVFWVDPETIRPTIYPSD